MHDAKQSLLSGIDREKWYVKQLLEHVLILQARGEKEICTTMLQLIVFDSIPVNSIIINHSHSGRLLINFV